MAIDPTLVVLGVKALLDIAPEIKDLITMNKDGIHIALTPEMIQELEDGDDEMWQAVTKFLS